MAPTISAARRSPGAVSSLAPRRHRGLHAGGFTRPPARPISISCTPFARRPRHARACLSHWKCHRGGDLGIGIESFLLQPQGGGTPHPARYRGRGVARRGAAGAVPDKLDTEQWLAVIEAAHRVGLADDRHHHVRPYRRAAALGAAPVAYAQLQQRTGGFTEFVPFAVRAYGGAHVSQGGPGAGRPSARRC